MSCMEKDVTAADTVPLHHECSNSRTAPRLNAPNAAGTPGAARVLPGGRKHRRLRVGTRLLRNMNKSTQRQSCPRKPRGVATGAQACGVGAIVCGTAGPAAGAPDATWLWQRSQRSAARPCMLPAATLHR